MGTSTPETVSPNPIATESQDIKSHPGPVARLLAKVSKLNGEYADYQMEAGIWRKLAL